jgi:glyoxylase-like metal-dependent hydrolase (beta-lactamase superfamily II)
VYFKQLLSGRDFAVGDPLAQQMVNFVYLIGDRSTGECMVIDPAYAVDDLIAVAADDGMKITGALATHYHPDHIGLAGWLCTRWQVPLEISRGEFLLARVLTLDTAATPPADVVAFYAAQGWPAEAVETLKASEWGRFSRGVHRLPTGYHRLRAGDRLTIGGRHWDVVVGSGHSPEHVCLHAAAEGILISGDQVLPRITSNVSVYPTEPEADPLGEWLDSIARLKTLPDDTLVLPAHNEPFLGLHARLDQLAADHTRKLEALLDACAEPLSAYDSFPTLFRRRISDDEIQMATGEALAHLRWLNRRGQVEPVSCDGVTRYRRIG